MAKQGVYRVEGRNELLLLEDDEWRYIPTEQALFSTGYGWGDVQVTDIATFCKYEIGVPVPAPGWPTTRGYLPNKSWYTTECAKIAPAPEPTPPEPPPEPTPPPPPPPGEMPIPIPPPYKMAYGVGNTESWFKQLAEGGFNLVQSNSWIKWDDAARDKYCAYALKYGMQIVIEPLWQKIVGTPAEPILRRYADNPAIWGIDWEEPYMRGIPIADNKTGYSFVKSINPKWRVFAIHGDDEWNRYGFCTSGYCHVVNTSDIYPCGMSNPEGYLRGKLTLLGYADCIRKMIDTWGIECCPVIMAWAYDKWNNKTCIRMQYEVTLDVLQRPLSGLCYYTTPSFLPVAGGDTRIWSQILEMNKTLGGYSPAIITIETLTHACGAKIQYRVSSVAAHNVALACPYDGASLGVKGINGSAVITNIDEMASKLQGEIATLDNKIAELQGRIETLRVQVAEATEIIGV